MPGIFPTHPEIKVSDAPAPDRHLTPQGLNCVTGSASTDWRTMVIRSVDGPRRKAQKTAAGRAVLQGSTQQDRVVFVGHGAVGTLLRQAMAGEPISRRGDQPAGGGSLFTFALPFGPVFSCWHRMEHCCAAPPGLAPAPGNHDAGGLDWI